MIVCICSAINDRQVRRAIADGHDTLEELQLELGVATRCGKCVAATCSLIEDARCAPVSQATCAPLRKSARPRLAGSQADASPALA